MGLPQLLFTTQRAIDLPDLPHLLPHLDIEFSRGSVFAANVDFETEGPPPNDNPVVSISLPFELESQPGDRGNWCWAAVTVSIVRFYNPESELTQCKLVNSIFGKEDCCFPNLECDEQWCLQNSLYFTCNYRDRADQLDFEAIRQEIAAERVLACRVESDGYGHFIVISGVHKGDSGEWIEIRDPLYDSGFTRFDDFLAKFGDGWTDSYFTKREGQ